ncbi:hypothetical protein [Anaeromyxobacter diazotrophicus]|uniref:Uncharacterized protein n=1 Tax=Anaeromyxobacter diazotrophicus TaxID=2590199 RepID=A0A7I9VG21_9BACT|nr:hypothetical protein [Anaeromyxobacter diazotrophicus]GEJ55323.1 hypothetical protein AMYX_00640 [Anaeromyxobacter diazotrophicus]
MPSVVAYHLDPPVTAQPQQVTEVALLAPPEPDAEGRLVRDLTALAEAPAAGPVAVQVERRGPQLEVTLRRAGLAIALPRVEPVARAHGVALASACSADGVLTLSLLVPRAAAVRG